MELHVCPCKNRAKSTIRGKAQKIKFAPLLHTVINFSSGDQEEVENIDIIPTIRTDHSAITLHLNGIKLLLDSTDFIKKIEALYSKGPLPEGSLLMSSEVVWMLGTKDFLRANNCQFLQQKLVKKHGTAIGPKMRALVINICQLRLF